MPLGPSKKFVENTILNPKDERTYKNWTHHYKMKDIDPETDEPYDDVKYDLRGLFKENRVDHMAGYGPPQFEGAHGPDKFKQHGHETFSQESKYSRGAWDGGMWVGDKLVQPPKPVASHTQRKTR